MKVEKFEANYDSKDRYCSYWHQVDEILRCTPVNVLEIGVGSGFLSRALRSRGISLTAVDIDQELKPDVVASVIELPFEDNRFDVVACFQVLEHLEFQYFSVALSEISRVTRGDVILSLPDLGRVYRFLIDIPKVGEIKFALPFPRLKRLEWQYNGEHYWNIGCKGYSLTKILNVISASGFTVRRQYRVFEMPWHRFFVLKKS